MKPDVINDGIVELDTGLSASGTTILCKEGQFTRLGIISNDGMYAKVVSRDVNGEITQQEGVLITAINDESITITRAYFPCRKNGDLNAPEQASFKFSKGDTLEAVINAEMITGLYNQLGDFTKRNEAETISGDWDFLNNVGVEDLDVKDTAKIRYVIGRSFMFAPSGYQGTIAMTPSENCLAYYDKWGTATSTKNGNEWSVGLNLFDPYGNSSYGCSQNDVIIVELSGNVNRVLCAGFTSCVDSRGPRSVKIEKLNGSIWSTIFEKTDVISYEVCYGDVGHNYEGIRYTFTNFSGGRMQGMIWGYGESHNQPTKYLHRGGGTIYGDLEIKGSLIGDSIPSNIISSNALIFSLDNFSNGVDYTTTKGREVVLEVSGTYQISFHIMGDTGSGDCSCQVRNNGTTIYTGDYDDSSLGVTRSFEYTFSAGDVVSFWGVNSDDTATVTEIKIMGTLVDYTVNL